MRTAQTQASGGAPGAQAPTQPAQPKVAPTQAPADEYAPRKTGAYAAAQQQYDTPAEPAQPAPAQPAPAQSAPAQPAPAQGAQGTAAGFAPAPGAPAQSAPAQGGQPAQQKVAANTGKKNPKSAFNQGVSGNDF